MQEHPHFRHRPACEVCENSGVTIVLSRSFGDPSVAGFLETYYAGAVDKGMLEGATYEIARCDECGFHWQRSVLKDDGLAALYGRWIAAGQSHEKRKSGDLSLYGGYAREMGYVTAFARKAPRNIRVLDHGMGWGYWCRMAIAFGFEAHGTELSEERRTHAAGMGVHIADIGALPPDFFDFINSEQSFEHIPEPGTNMKRLARSLRKGGVLRVAVPDAGRDTAALSRPDWKAAKDAFHPLEHINAFTRPALVRLGAEAGLTPVRRPVFPIFAWNVPSLIRGFLAPFYYARRGTIVYFRKA